MTSDLALIALGSITTVATFVIGVLVGRVSRRTDHDDSNGNEKELPTRWRHDCDGNTQAGTRGRGGSGADASRKADAYERAVRKWHSHGDGS